MLLGALASALLTGVVCTLISALAALRANIFGVLRTTGPATTGHGAPLRSAFTIVQIAGSLTLLVGALLLVRTVQNLSQFDRGYAL